MSTAHDTASAHTAGPWHVHDYSPERQQIFNANNEYVGAAEVTGSEHYPNFEKVKANAARIVACVNACEGINPEAVPELLEHAKHLLSFVETCYMCEGSGKPSRGNDDDGRCANCCGQGQVIQPSIICEMPHLESILTKAKTL